MRETEIDGEREREVEREKIKQAQVGYFISPLYFLPSFAVDNKSRY